MDSSSVKVEEEFVKGKARSQLPQLLQLGHVHSLGLVFSVLVQPVLCTRGCEQQQPCMPACQSQEDEDKQLGSSVRPEPSFHSSSSLAMWTPLVSFLHPRTARSVQTRG